MQIETPWFAGGDDAREAAGAASFPGIEECALPELWIRPVVHRFESVVLLDGEVVPVPGIHDWIAKMRARPDAARTAVSRVRGAMGLAGATRLDALDSLASIAPSLPGLTAMRTHHFWPVRPWQLIRPKWGLHVVVEQAWDAQGVTLGELVGGISLAPGEEREVSVYSWHKSKQTLDFSTSELVDRRSSTQLTTHDSFQVLSRAEKESHWEASMELSYGKGAASGTASASSGGSTKDILERQFKRTRDLTRKVSEQIRSERTTRVTTVEEEGSEERRKIKLANPNPCHSVSYFLYEVLSHYRVRSAPAEVCYVVVVPNPLPIISPEWVSCHEGALREALLDENVADGFAAARRLLTAIPENDLLAVAIALRDEFRPLPPEAFEEDDDGGGWGLPLLDAVTAIGRVLVSAAEGLSSLFDSGGSDGTTHPVDVLGKPPSTESVQGYLDQLVVNPSLASLAGALLLLARYYRDNALPPGLSRAFGRAVNLITVAAGASASGSDEAAESEGQLGIEQEQLDLRASGEERAAAEVAFERLRCHLEDHLLHYMRHIWIAEDPADRYARLSSYSVAGERLWDIAENRLLGFHLNGSILPVHLGEDVESVLDKRIRGGGTSLEEVEPRGLSRFAASAGSFEPGLEELLAETRQRLRLERKERVTPALLSREVRRSLARALPSSTGKEEPATRTLERALHELSEQLKHIEAEQLLTPAEKSVFDDIAEVVRVHRSAAPDKGLLKSHLEQLTDAAQGLLDLSKDSEMFLALPSTAVHLEPSIGKCSACGDHAGRKVEAETGLLESERGLQEIELRRKTEKVDQGNLDPEPGDAVLRVRVEGSLDEA